MNKNSLKILAYSMFFVSLVLTVTLLSKNATGWNILLMLMLGLCLELSKCYMLHLAIINKNKFYLIISIMLFMFSFVASISAFTNNSLKVSEQAKIESLEYKATLDRIKDLEVLKNSYSDNYKTKKDEIGNEILVLKKSLNKIEVKSGKGTSEVFNLLGGIFGVDPSILFIVFNVLIALVFELTTVVLFLESLDGKVVIIKPQIEEVKQPIIEEKKEVIKPVEHIDSNKVATKEVEEIKPLFEPQVEPIAAVKKINKIGFDTDLKKPQIKPIFTNKEVNKYKKFMIKDAKERDSNIASGYKKIAKEIGLAKLKL